MADMNLTPEEFRRRIDEVTKIPAGSLIDICGNKVVSPTSSAVIGVATENFVPLKDYPGVHTGVVRLNIAAPSDIYVSVADDAMKTLPSIVQRIIYRYAKWRLR